jgi:folate-binding protein YgfZ
MSLSLENATLGGDGPLHEDLEAARSGSIVASLPHLSVLAFSGEDAESFLQGQVSCDVAAVRDAASFGGYASPQGRMLASFLLWRGESGLFMALAADVAASVQQRLARFVLRARVTIESPALVLAGASGPAAPSFPAGRLEVRRSGGGETVIRLDESRVLLALPAAEAEARLAGLAAGARRVDARAWRWLDIRGGVPWITAATQDRLIPQMVNLERIGGVSFTKGCYTGQEVVARAQHRGAVKRRMFVANVNDLNENAAAAGDQLYAEDLGDQAAGIVVDAVPSPDGGSDLLAVVQIASREGSIVHLRSLTGPALRFL